MEILSQEGEKKIVDFLDNIVKAASDVRSDLFFVMVEEKPETEFLQNFSKSVRGLRNAVNAFYQLYNDLEMEIEDREYMKWQKAQMRAEADYYNEFVI